MARQVFVMWQVGGELFVLQVVGMRSSELRGTAGSLHALAGVDRICADRATLNIAVVPHPEYLADVHKLASLFECAAQTTVTYNWPGEEADVSYLQDVGKFITHRSALELARSK